MESLPNKEKASSDDSNSDSDSSSSSSSSNSSSSSGSNSSSDSDNRQRKQRWQKNKLERQSPADGPRREDRKRKREENSPDKSPIIGARFWRNKESRCEPEEGEISPIGKTFSESPRSDRPRREDRRRRRREESRDKSPTIGERFWRDKEHEEGEIFPVGDRYWDDKEKAQDEKKEAEGQPMKKRKNLGDEAITTRTGGAYIPPARLKMMQAEITDKSSIAYQRLSWEALKKSINGLINKINVSNIGVIVVEICKENIVRGSGVLARAVIQAQAVSGTFTAVYASLVSVINSKYPQIGELILKRLIIQFRKGFKRNDKTICLSSTRFIAHLINQLVAHEVLALEILTLLLETPTEDSVEVAVSFLKECGQKLKDVTPRGINAIFERLRSVLHESLLDKRIQYMIEVMFAVRKDNFVDFPSIPEKLDLIEEEDQFTHMVTLDEAVDAQQILDVFKFDENFEKNEETYKMLSRGIDGDSDDSDDSGKDDSGSDDDDSDNDENEEGENKTIIDTTETNLVALRRTIYLTVQSSLSFEECTHKILRLNFKPEQQMEVCHMVVDCCTQERTYIKFYGLLAQRFCQLNRVYVEPFEQIFRSTYDTIHRIEINKQRNVTKLFAHLLFTDAISWMVLSHLRLNEDDTTSSSRIFIKILFLELSEYMGMAKLYDRVKDVTLQDAFEGLFPRNNPRDTRFAINFFTTIGLGGLTDELREHLKEAPKAPIVPQEQDKQAASSSSSSSSDSSSSGSSSDSSSSDSSSSDSDSSSTSSSSSSNSENEKMRKKRSKVRKDGAHQAKSRDSDKGKRYLQQEEYIRESRQPEGLSDKRRQSGRKDGEEMDGRTNRTGRRDEHRGRRQDVHDDRSGRRERVERYNAEEEGLETSHRKNKDSSSAREENGHRRKEDRYNARGDENGRRRNEDKFREREKNGHRRHENQRRSGVHEENDRRRNHDRSSDREKNGFVRGEDVYNAREERLHKKKGDDQRRRDDDRDNSEERQQRKDKSERRRRDNQQQRAKESREEEQSSRHRKKEMHKSSRGSRDDESRHNFSRRDDERSTKRR